jgi:pimeloyl-ACP methyl ester carboxylesterase
MRRVLLFSAAAAALLLAGSAALAEAGLRVRHRGTPAVSAAEAVVAGTGARWQSEQVRSGGGVTLDGWLFTPARTNGGAVLALHGNGARRESMMPHVRYLLAAGYTVLAPDQRAHGASGGDIETYGLREAGDVRHWLDLLASLHGNARLYGLGESLGAAVLIQALPAEKRLRAVVADCPFATFEDAAFDRLYRRLYLPRFLAWTPLHLGLAYSRAIHGVDLRESSPAAAMRSVTTPVLLIHGMDDRSTPLRHSRDLHAANPAATELWEVPAAGHTRSRAAQPDEYQHRVVAWFGAH